MTTHTLPDRQLSTKQREEILAHRKGLYRHAKRPEWGLAILAWEEGGRRGYQFDDGRLRVFKEGYYSLMEPVDVQAATEVRRDLQEAMELSTRHAARKELTPEYPFEEQLAIFRELYPDGFADLGWIRTYRGSGETVRRKSHREPALREAVSVLGRATMEDQLERGAHDEMLADLSALLATTDLVPVRKARSLVDVPTDLRRPVAEALHALLHGEGKIGPRFHAWVLALRDARGERPAWRLATAPLALLLPQEHVCVRPSTFRRQAAVFAPGRVYTTRARRRSYTNFLHVAQATRERLEAEGLRPRDLLDVHDFVWVTLRPAAAKHRSAT